jgi:tetratricopeptide (TPR) repeat protein
MKARIPLLLFVVALCAGIVLPATATRVTDEVQITTTSPEARNDYQKAIALVYNVRLDEARTLLVHAATLDKDFAMAQYMLSVLAPNTDAAITHLTAATALTGKITEGERLLIEARQALLTGSITRSEELTQKVIQMHPEDVWARSTLAALLYSTNRNEEAITELERILSIQPGCPTALNLLGYTNMALGRNEAAEAAFMRYVEAVPDEPNPHDSYAEFLMKLGRFDESIRSYDKALAVDKNFHSATIGIGNNLILQGHPAAARLRFQTLYENAGTTEWKRSALSGLIRAFITEGKYERAIAEAKRLRDISVREKNQIETATDLNLISTLLLASTAVDPKSGVYLKSRTADSRRINQVNATIHDAYRALEGTGVSNDATTRVRLGLLATEIEAAVQENDLVTARRKADEHRALASRTGDPRPLQDAATIRAIIAVAEKRYTDALDDLKFADLTNARTLFRLMEIHEALGNAAEARDVKRRILAVNDGSLQFAMVRRWVTE